MHWVVLDGMVNGDGLTSTDVVAIGTMMGEEVLALTNADVIGGRDFGFGVVVAMFVVTMALLRMMAPQRGRYFFVSAAPPGAALAIRW